MKRFLNSIFKTKEPKKPQTFEDIVGHLPKHLKMRVIMYSFPSMIIRLNELAKTDKEFRDRATEIAKILENYDKGSIA